MTKIQFYTNPMSRGQIVRWALHEAGADYDQHIIDYGDAIKSDDYLAVNPMGKVPAIMDNGEVVTECAAICAYLADRFPEANLAPALQERASYYRWLFYAAGPVEAAITNNNLGWVPSEEQRRTVGYGSFDQVMDLLDSHLGTHEYFCHGRFTAADIYLGSHISWGLQFGTVEKRDSFAAYAERLQNRPAFKVAKAVDEALIAEMQQPA